MLPEIIKIKWSNTSCPLVSGFSCPREVAGFLFFILIFLVFQDGVGNLIKKSLLDCQWDPDNLWWFDGDFWLLKISLDIPTLQKAYEGQKKGGLGSFRTWNGVGDEGLESVPWLSTQLSGLESQLLFKKQGKGIFELHQLTLALHYF